MRKECESFVQRLDTHALDQRTALEGVFRDCIGDSIVEAPIKSAKFINVDRCATFERQVRNGLAQIAVVVNDLVDREPVLPQLSSVQSGGCGNLGRSRTPPEGPETLRLRKGSVVCSNSRVLMSWSRKLGIPWASSTSVTFGATL